MKALVGAFNQEKALVGAFSVIVQPVVEPMEHYTALPTGCPPPTWRGSPSGTASSEAAAPSSTARRAASYHSRSSRRELVKNLSTRYRSRRI